MTPVGLLTPPWQGSIAARGCSSLGRAPSSQGGGKGFESPHLHVDGSLPQGDRLLTRSGYKLPLARWEGSAVRNVGKLRSAGRDARIPFNFVPVAEMV